MVELHSLLLSSLKGGKELREEVEGVLSELDQELMQEDDASLASVGAAKAGVPTVGADRAAPTQRSDGNSVGWSAHIGSSHCCSAQVGAVWTAQPTWRILRP